MIGRLAAAIAAVVLLYGCTAPGALQSSALPPTVRPAAVLPATDGVSRPKDTGGPSGGRSQHQPISGLGHISLQ